MGKTKFMEIIFVLNTQRWTNRQICSHRAPPIKLSVCLFFCNKFMKTFVLMVMLLVQGEGWNPNTDRILFYIIYII